MTVGDIVSKLELKVFSGEDLMGKTVKGCYIGDLLSLAMSKVQFDNVWITIQTNMNIVAVAALADAGAIILADGFSPDDAALKKAQEQGVVLLGSESSAYELAVKLAELGI